jgi:hypothetical protein
MHATYTGGFLCDTRQPTESRAKPIAYPENAQQSRSQAGPCPLLLMPCLGQAHTSPRTARDSNITHINRRPCPIKPILSCSQSVPLPTPNQLFPRPDYDSILKSPTPVQSSPYESRPHHGQPKVYGHPTPANTQPRKCIARRTPSTAHEKEGPFRPLPARTHLNANLTPPENMSGWPNTSSHRCHECYALNSNCQAST